MHLFKSHSSPVVHADDAVREAHHGDLPLKGGRGGEVVEGEAVLSEGQEQAVHVGQHHHVSDPGQLRAATLQLNTQGKR